MRRGRLRPWVPRNQRSGLYKGSRGGSERKLSFSVSSRELPRIEDRTPQKDETFKEKGDVGDSVHDGTKRLD